MTPVWGLLLYLLDKTVTKSLHNTNLTHSLLMQIMVHLRSGVEQQAMPIQPLSCTTSLLSINVSTLTVFQIWLWLPVVHRSYVTITHGLTLILNAPLFASIMSGLNLYYVKIWLQFYPVDTTTGLTLVSCPELVFSYITPVYYW
jgi:hypothetical protein